MDLFESYNRRFDCGILILYASFIVFFSNHAPDPERDSALVQEFLANMEMAFKAHPLCAGCSEEELESAGEGSCLIFSLMIFHYGKGLEICTAGLEFELGRASLVRA
jgi:hypothetical protein